MALAYIRDALPKDATHPLAHHGTVAVGAILLGVGLLLASVHVAAERRRSTIAHLSKPTKLASIVPAIGGSFLLLTWNSLPQGAAAATGPELTWERDEPATVARAVAEHKPMLVDFGASWCGACKELDEKTFSDPRVRMAGARFVALHVDATDDEDKEVARVRQKYRATEGLPVVLLFDAKGTEAVRFTEFVPPDRFAAALAKVR